MTVFSRHVLPKSVIPFEDLRRPTKVRSGSHNVEHTIQKFLAFHPRSAPFDFHRRTKDCDLRDVLTKFNVTHFKEVNDFNRSASAGVFFKKRGYRKQRDVLDCPKAMKTVENTIHYCKMGKPVTFLSFVCAASATQDLDTGDVKVRPVWVQDFTLLYIEKMLIQDLWSKLDHRKRVPTPEKLCSTYCTDGTFLDYNSFDAQLPNWLIKTALLKIFSYCDISRYARRGTPYSHHSLERLINIVCSNILYTRFITPFVSTIRRKFHGVPSGSYLTHLLDTVCSRLLLSYIGSYASRYTATSYGDDSYITTYGEISDDKIVAKLEGIGFSVRIEDRNVTGHGIYCKAWCVNGFSFHPGIWFSNILNCLKFPQYLNIVIDMLILAYNPTDRQAAMLRYMKREDLPSKVSSESVPFAVIKILTFSGKEA